MAGIALVGDGGLVEADPHRHSAQETRALGHRQQRVERAAVEQAEVARVRLEVHLRELVEQPVEPRSRGQLERGLAGALLANGVHHLGALAPASDHLGDQLGGILQVGVEHRHDVAACVLQAGGQRGLVAEVARKVDHAHARVGGGNPVEQLRRGVGAAVVDDHELKLVVGGRRARASDELLDELLLVVHRRYDAEQRGSAKWVIRHRGALCRACAVFATRPSWFTSVLSRG